MSGASSRYAGRDGFAIDSFRFFRQGATSFNGDTTTARGRARSSEGFRLPRRTATRGAVAVIFGFDEFELDAERLELRRGGKLVKADTLVLRFLAVLVQNAGRLVTKEELVEQVWEGRAVADNVLTVSMARLRKTLGQSRGQQELIVTVYGRGYRFVRPVVARSGASWAPPPVLATSAPGLPYVGRERVLERLRQALAEANAGRGRMCVLIGEAGIGKTRAVEVLERELIESGVRVA